MKILAINATNTLNIAESCKKIKEATGIQPEVDFIDIPLPLSFKSFDDTSLVKGLWGLDGIKQQLRDSKRIPDNYYHQVWFFYHWSGEYKVAAWTYPESLNGSVFCEFPEIDVVHLICHEFLHGCHRLCSFKGLYTQDTMDKYDGDLEPMSGANYQRNIAELKPYFAYINIPLKNFGVRAYLIKFIAQLNMLLLELQTPPKKDLIKTFCEAIQTHEGWYQGSRSYRNSNPGNVKYVGQAKAIGQDENGFAIFNNYTDGFNYLMIMVRNACSGLSNVHNPNETILEFFGKYAPSGDGNDVSVYATYVASKVGVSINTQIKELL